MATTNALNYIKLCVGSPKTMFSINKTMIVECKYNLMNHQMCIFVIENFSFKELFKKMQFGYLELALALHFKLYRGD